MRTQGDLLQAIREAHEHKAVAEQRRVEAAAGLANAVRDAKKGGVPVSVIAAEAGMSKQAIYQLVNDPILNNPKEDAVNYWLKMNGTAAEPYDRPDWMQRREDWWAQVGQVEKLSKRLRMEPGDRLITLAVGSHQYFGEARLFSVLEVLGTARPSEGDQWGWEVPVRVLVDGPLLNECPTLADIGKERSSIRRHSAIRLTAEEGARAEMLIREAASGNVPSAA